LREEKGKGENGRGIFSLPLGKEKIEK